MTSKQLPKELKTLVGKNLTLLGQVILEEGGQKLFKKVENIRQSMVKYRGSNNLHKEQLLESLYLDLKKQNKESRHLIAHSISLMFELINTCESSFRTHRLKNKKLTEVKQRQTNKLVYVLTAHPTEARTSENIELFARIQSLLLKILDQTGEDQYLYSLVKHNLKLLWLIPITHHKKPQVVDEANHLFSIIMREDIFNTLLRANRDLGTVRVRTWVGGDKDGHPGVDEKVMVTCLEASRHHFIKIFDSILKKVGKDVALISSEPLKNKIKQRNDGQGKIPRGFFYELNCSNYILIGTAHTNDHTLGIGGNMRLTC